MNSKGKNNLSNLLDTESVNTPASLPQWLSVVDAQKGGNATSADEVFLNIDSSNNDDVSTVELEGKLKKLFEEAEKEQAGGKRRRKKNLQKRNLEKNLKESNLEKNQENLQKRNLKKKLQKNLQNANVNKEVVLLKKLL